MTSRETIGIRSLKHGHTIGRAKTPEYEAYCSAKRRCNSPTRKDYPRYGGRGIRFLFRDFPHFLEEIGERPGAGYSLGRINNDGHYEPGNVRWETLIQQNNNRRPRRKGGHRVFTAEHIQHIKEAQIRRRQREKGVAA